MKRFVIGGLAAAAFILPSAAAAQSAQSLFRCTLANGRTVSVTARGDAFTYRYGTPRRAELTLRATPQSRTAFYKQERRWATATQMRFTNGDYSYIVHSIPAHQSGDPQGFSGVTVLRGDRTIADHSCRRLAEIGDWDVVSRLPEDEDRWARFALEQ